jgi:hypothetical protein
MFWLVPGTTYHLDMMESPADFESMGYENVTSSSNPLGDFHAVELYGYAYLAGGISHLSNWCEGLKMTERYHMTRDVFISNRDFVFIIKFKCRHDIFHFLFNCQPPE